MDLKELDLIGDSIATHWYYRSKAAAMTSLLGTRPLSVLLDVGAGSAFFSRHLLRSGMASEAWCVDTSYPMDHDEWESGKPLRFRKTLGAVNAQVVLLMDVLEHVDDDVGLLREYVDKVPAGTRFLISVPAFRFLWSGHDEFLEHKRRYTLREIEAVAKAAGLTIDRGAYYFGFVFPIAVASRLLKKVVGRSADEPASQLTVHHPLINGLLGWACRLELPVFRINRIAGLSALCIAAKP